MKRLAFALTCVAGIAAHAATWHVAPEGTDDGTNDGKSWSQPFATLSNAVAKLTTSGETIIMSNGVYRFERRVTIPKEKLTLRSLTLDPKDVIFDGQDKVGLVSADKWATRIYGITFQNARYDGTGGSYGVALYLRGSETIVSNCVFRNNFNRGTQTAYGGALSVQSFANSVPCKIYDTIFENNALVTTNTAAGPYSSRGGAASLIYAMVTNCIFRCNVNTNHTSGSYYNICAGGGVYAENSKLYCCNIYSNEVVNTRQSTAGYGGGVFLTGRESLMKNCLVWANGAENSGGGISVWSALVEDCTISNNVVRTKYYSGSDVCGAGVAMDAGTLRNCHVITNRFLGSVSYCGGGSGVCAKHGARIDGCLIEHNRGQKAVLACMGDGGYGGTTIFSNCVIRSNYSSVNGTLLYSFNGDTTLITDSWVTDNRGPSLVYCAVQWNNRAPHTFRNLYVYGNKITDNWSPVLYSCCEYSFVSTQRYENCTFAYNRQVNGNNGPFIRDHRDGNWGKGQPDSLIFLDRCAIWECGSWLCDTEAKYPWWQSQNANYCLLPTIPASMADCHNLAATGTGKVDPKFVDAANGDMRVAEDSPLVNAGGAAQAWMGGDNQRRGARDMGDGTYTITRSGAYGVSIARNNARPRLSGALPDIGCCEYYFAPGLMLLYK